MDKDEIVKNEPEEQKTQAKPARRPYVKPEAVYLSMLEAQAGVCDTAPSKRPIGPDPCSSTLYS
jgi:hypothetical protein